jgi:uncharacterized protein YndB with AHSA1/START domain
MTERSVTHATFCIERSYPHPPSRVYAAFATEAGKRAWFGGAPGDWDLLEREFDFRAGGVERLRGRWKSGVVSDFHARYCDIVPDARIVYAYDMHIDDRHISVSLATIEFKAHAAGTRLVLTEQGAFLDGYDDAGSREHGTKILMDRMGESLANLVA